MLDLTSVLPVVCVREPGDPAIDRAAKGVQLAVSEYDRWRSAETLDALRKCVLPGRKLVEFHLSPLTMDGIVYATEGTDPAGTERLARAFQCACFLIVDEAGDRIAAEMMTNRETPQATRAWVSKMAAKFGINAIREMGALALRRAEVTSEATDPYVFLRGAPRPAL